MHMREYLAEMQKAIKANFDVKDSGMLEDKDEEDMECAEGTYDYEDPKTGEIFTFRRKGIYVRNGRTLIPAF